MNAAIPSTTVGADDLDKRSADCPGVSLHKHRTQLHPDERA